MDLVKRGRCSNFNKNEMEVLLTLVEEHKKIIECKKTDTVSNREKDAEWEKNCHKFNALIGSGRTAKQLRMKWDSWKKSIRKNYSLSKCSMYKTGGGPCDNTGLSSFEERILAIIGISAIGVECTFDSDSTTEYDSNPSSSGNASISNEIMQDIVCEFASPAPKVIWREPLVPVKPLNILETLQVQESNRQEPSLVVQELQPSTSKDSEQAVSNDDDKENDKITWKQWNPALLKKQVHPLLDTINMRESVEEGSSTTSIKQASLPSTPGRLNLKSATAVQKLTRKRKCSYNRNQPILTNKHGLLLDKKIELVTLQIEVLKKEHEMREKRNAEKHEVEMMLLKNKCDCKLKNSL